ncbi:MAG: CFI-box-CTERM domain-containing protein, partial [Planctomycetota bacterium]
ELRNNTDVDVVGLLSSEAGIVNGAPVVGGTKTIVPWGTGGSLSVFPGLNSPPPRNELANAANVEMTQFALVASTVEAVRVTAMTVTHRGTGNAQTDVTQVRLYRDVAGNGILDTNDVLIGTGVFDINGEVTFTFGGNEVVAQNSEMNYLVAYDLSGTAAMGSTFILGVDQNTHVTAEGVSSFATINISGAPVDGSALIIGTTGSLIVTYGSNNPGLTYIPAPTSDVRIMHVSFRATSPEDILVKSVAFHAGGTGDDVNTVTASLFADVNGNGVVDGSDYPLGTINQVFDADNGVVTFQNVNLTVPAGTVAYAVLSYNFDIDPSQHWGDSYEVRLLPSLDVSCEGVTSASTLFSAGSTLFSNRAIVGYPPGYLQYVNLPGGSSGGGCFIATACFGSRSSAEVRTLSSFRDRYLLGNGPGRFIVRTYYRLSPPVADFLRDKPAAKWMVRQALTPVAGFAGAFTSGSALPLVVLLALVAASLGFLAILARKSLKLAKETAPR